MSTPLKLVVFPSEAEKSGFADAEPNKPLAAEEVPSFSLVVEYEREDTTADDGGVGAPVALPARVVRTIVPPERAEIDLGDYSPNSDLRIAIESARGIRIEGVFSQKPSSTPARKVITSFFGYSVKKIKAAGARPDLEPLKSLDLSRAGRFVTFANSEVVFEHVGLLYAPLHVDVHAKLITALAKGALSYPALEKDHKDLANQIAAMPLYEGVIKKDGTFSLRHRVQLEKFAGWLWILTGKVQFVGHLREADTPPQVVEGLAVPVPVSAPAGTPGAAGGGATTPGGGVPSPAAAAGGAGATGGGAAAGGSSAPPAATGAGAGGEGGGGDGEDGDNGGTTFDADEQELLAFPELFSDDPGPYCLPFQNPNRILSERSFHTVVRVENTEVGLTAKNPERESFFPFLVRQPMMRAMNYSVAPRVGGNGFLSRMGNFFSGGAALVQPAMVPPMLSLPQDVRTNLLNLHFIGDTGRKRVSATNPVDWETTVPGKYQVTNVVGGHILDWRVRWRANGYSLGDVAHTLTLAPRQTRRITKLTWERREMARRTEGTAQADQVAQTTTRARDYLDVVTSNMREWSKGKSNAEMSGAAGGAGFGYDGFVIGGGATYSNATTTSEQRSERSLAAAEEQALRDAIRQYGESLRKLESTVVVEATQAESIEGVSEVIRNINYAHSITVIYHEILRHLRVDTELVGVRECVFVPFEIRPFNVARATRWMDYLARGLLERSHLQSLKYLPELIDTNGQITFRPDTEIPPGERADIPVRAISGYADIRISVARPIPSNLKFPEDFAKIHEVAPLYARLYPYEWDRVAQQLAFSILPYQIRNHAWHRAIAPVMVKRWLDTLKVSFGRSSTTVSPIAADFVTVGGVGNDQIVRVRFSANFDGGMSRRNLASAVLEATHDLPPGSSAVLQAFGYTYRTDDFERTVQPSRELRDMVDITDGSVRAVDIRLPLDNWETVNLRERIRKQVEDFLVHLNANALYYHKLIWWNLDHDEVFMLLDGFEAPWGQGRSIASLVQRVPIGMLGNCLVFQASSGVFLGVNGIKTPNELHQRYARDGNSVPIRISLPTDGLYAQTIMDPCVAAEEHMGSIDWVLTDKDPQLEELGEAMLASRRAEPSGLAPTEFQGPIINLQNAPQAPDPTGLGGALTAVSREFKDITGTEGTQAMAKAASETAAQLATSFGSMAVDLKKAEMGTQQADRKLASIKKARNDKLINDDQASQQTMKALDSMNVTPAPQSLKDDPNVSKAIQKGGKLEVSRVAQGVSEAISVDNGRGQPILASAGQALNEIATPRFYVAQSVGAGGINAVSDVERVRARLTALGFDWIALNPDGTPNADFVNAIRLFQAIVHGREGDFSGFDGLIERNGVTERWMQAANAPRWARLEDGSAAQGFLFNPSMAGNDRYGTDWLLNTIRHSGRAYLASLGGALNDNPAMNVHELSNPRGGPNPPHGGHQTGLNCDVRLPRNDGAAGGDNSTNVGGVTFNDPAYNQDLTRRILTALNAQPLVITILFNDPVLIAEGLCRRWDDHDDHIHIRIEPPAQGDIETEIVVMPAGTAIA